MAEYQGDSPNQCTRGNSAMWKSGNSKATEIGYINRNNQKVLGTRGVRGNDHGQYSYNIERQNGGCRYTYGANGSDIFQRKCPKCQRDKKALSIKHIAIHSTRWQAASSF